MLQPSSGFLLLLLAAAGSAKVFERCQLARELLRLQVDPKDVPTWVCIAQRESNLNTSALGNLNADGSGDHGLFQISDKYWCSPQGWACNIPCSLLEDDDITDDWKCARRIFKQHRAVTGNGFNAWAVYRSHCSGDTESYVEGCFNQAPTEEEVPPESTSAPAVDDIVESYSAREGNNAEKVQVLDLEMMKKGKSYKTISVPGRLWKPWTWDI